MQESRSVLPLIAFVLTALLAGAAAGQQQPVGKKRIPSLTTDDVVRPPAEQPSPETASSKPAEAGKPTPGKPAESQTSTEESSWRDRVDQARDKAKKLERAAEEAELRVTQLRNELGVSGQSPKYRNEIAAEIERTGQLVKQLREQARAAADELTGLLDYGRERGFKEAEGPKPVSAEGKPNEDYYRSRLAELNEAIQDARRRVELYQNRVNDISQRILMTGGKHGGDNFYILQLQKDRDEAQQKLEESRAALYKAQTDLDALKEEARRAGVSLDIFRE
jgi:seryl-tRNA synthetase